MKITDIQIYNKQLKILFENNQYIIYSKFGNTLFAGDRLTSLVNKQDPILLEIKQIANNSDYFTDKDNNDIVFLKSVLSRFIGVDVSSVCEK